MGDETKEQVNLAAKFGAKIKGLSTAKADLERQVAELKTQLGTVTTERDQLKGQVLSPDAAAKKTSELHGKLCTLHARREFDRLAKAAGFPDGALDTLYRDSGHEAKSEQPDVEALTAAVEGLKTSHAWALGTQPAEGTTPPPPERKPIPGQGRGGAHAGTDATLVTRDQLSDPKFMLNPANRDVIVAAAKEHRFRG